jgi:hypothetical protein
MKYMKLCGISVYITVEVSEDGESWERRSWTGMQLLDVLYTLFPAYYEKVRNAATDRVTAELVFRVFGAGYIFDRDNEL